MAVLVLLLAACTAHDPVTARGSGDVVERLGASFRASTMSPEELEAFENRAQLRERQRKGGLRVCEEGEHGTRWKEDCKTCQCEHGLRTCPAVMCTHARDKMKATVKKHPRER